MWIVEGLENGKLALIATMHHSTVDGVSGAELLGVLFDLEPDPPVQPPVPSTPLTPGSRRTPNSSPRRWSRACSSRWASRGPSGARVSPCSVSAGSANPRSAPKGRCPSPPAHQLQLSAERAAAGRVRSRQPRRCEAPQERYGHDRQRRRARHLHGGAPPLSRRWRRAARHPARGGRAGLGGARPRRRAWRQQGLGDVRRPPRARGRPIKRLDLIHEGTRGAKEEHQALGADTLLNWAEHATPNVFALASRFYSRMRLADRHRPIANLVISNVPGPEFPLYLGGAEMLAGFPFGPVMDGMASTSRS